MDCTRITASRHPRSALDPRITGVGGAAVSSAGATDVYAELLDVVLELDLPALPFRTTSLDGVIGLHQ
jgi:hypothetical protein